MSWGDDPDLQAQVSQMRRLLEQLEVGVLWGCEERRDAGMLLKWLSGYCFDRDPARQQTKQHPSMVGP